MSEGVIMTTIGDVVLRDTGDYGVVTSSGTISPITVNTTTSSINIVGNATMEDLFDTWELNRVTVDHKVAGHEFLKLKEVAPNYADEIKENLAKTATRDIMKKMSFTKKLDKDADVHHFIGRVWVFTEEELKSFIKDVRSV
jgi:hypothetical protein